MLLISGLSEVTGSRSLETMHGTMGLRGLLCVCLASLLTLQAMPAQGSPTRSPKGGKVCE